MSGIATAVVAGAVISGVASNKAADKQADAIKSGQNQNTAMANQARREVKELFPQATISQQQGYQSAIDLLGGSMPQQANLAMGGNQAAQNTMLAAMPQYQNAILGAPVDYSQFQSYTPEVDFTGMANAMTPFMQQQQIQSTIGQTGVAPPPNQDIQQRLLNSVGPFNQNDPRSGMNIGPRALLSGDQLYRGMY